jgi:hypothetical protein
VVSDGRIDWQDKLTKVPFDRQRIRLPAHIVAHAKHPRFAGNAIKCWLLVVAPGRYRIVMQSAEAPTGALARIIQQIDELEEFGDVLDGTGNNARDAIAARLIPCMVTLTPRVGWRVNFPEAAKDLLPEKEERAFVFLRIVAGYVELWFPSTLRRALSVPLSQVLG